MRRVASGLLSTLRYLLRTEVHVHAFAIAANVLLSFYPFLIVTMSLTRAFFGERVADNVIGLALRDYFPDALQQFLYRNLPRTGPIQMVSIVLLLFTSNGVFEPLEVALNRIWGIHKDRSFFRNQLVSLALIFICGGVVLASLMLTALNQQSFLPSGLPVGSLVRVVSGSAAWFSLLFFKAAALPMSVFVIFLIYRFLPNGRPPLNRVIPGAIGAGLVLEAMKYVSSWVWPGIQRKISDEYGVFQFSVTLIFLSFLASLIVLAGAEWAARGHILEPLEEPVLVEVPSEEPETVAAGPLSSILEPARIMQVNPQTKPQARLQVKTDEPDEPEQALTEGLDPAEPPDGQPASESATAAESTQGSGHA